MKEIDHPRLVGGGFNSKGNLHMRTKWQPEEEISAPARHILKIYIEALSGFSRIYHLESLSNTLLPQDRILENGGNNGQNVRSKGRRKMKRLITRVQLSDQPQATSLQ